jgi:hypothetical protein
MPDPCKYFPSLEPVVPAVKMGKFSKSAKFSAQSAVSASTGHEPPEHGTYEVGRAQDFMDPFLPTGGKNILTQHKPKDGYFDDVVKPYQDIPGPGQYQQKQLPKRYDFSQAVYHQSTDTMEETKKLVKGALSHEVPGPGAYDIPDPPRL